MEINKLTPGRFCWSELATSDDKAATKFYSDFFEWKTETHSMGPGHGDYTMLSLNGKDVGGLYPLMPEQKSQGVPPHWLSYVGVEDVDTATEKARSLGGTCVLDRWTSWTRAACPSSRTRRDPRSRCGRPRPATVAVSSASRAPRAGTSS